MGCYHSTDVQVKDHTGSDRDTPSWAQFLLTDKQKDIIFNTWRFLSDNAVSHGIRVFQYIFLRQPNVRQLFRFRDVANEDLVQNPYFRGHAMHFMQAIGAAVDNVDDLERLTPMLLALGEQHFNTAGFGIQNFDLFTQCLILVWDEKLGDRFSPDVKAAWEKLFVFILMTLREGYRQAQGQKDSQSSLFEDELDEQEPYESKVRTNGK